MHNLKMLNTFQQESELIEEYIKKKLDGKRESIILEAGCGRGWSLRLDKAKFKYKTVGIDLDRDALEMRTSKTKDLDEAILGDLRYIDFGDRKFDIIYNSFVLEHIKNADLVLKNFHHWLKPGGLLILKIPDRNSVFGLITRITPHWVHIAYKKHLRNLKKAGQPGFGPHKTFCDKIICRDGIHGFCRKNNLIIEEEYGWNGYLRREDTITKLIKIFAITVSKVTIGRFPWEHNNLTYILRKDICLTNKDRS